MPRSERRAAMVRVAYEEYVADVAAAAGVDVEIAEREMRAAWDELEYEDDPVAQVGADEPMTTAEIASIMGCSAQNVSVIEHRAMKKLVQRFGRDEMLRLLAFQEDAQLPVVRRGGRYVQMNPVDDGVGHESFKDIDDAIRRHEGYREYVAKTSRFVWGGSDED